jgi:hypothetical protein
MVALSLLSFYLSVQNSDATVAHGSRLASGGLKAARAQTDPVGLGNARELAPVDIDKSDPVFDQKRPGYQ